MKQTKNFIFHVDLDCFYAAVEMRENPDLKEKPLIVGGNKETKRGVVLTCNYEARKYGIHSGMPALQAFKLCPKLVSVRGSRQLYKEVSNSVMSILSAYTAQFRRASIDEAYLNLTAVVKNQFDGNPVLLAQEIKDEILDREKITCSIGIGPNTTIAKMATEQNKPDGITYVPLEGVKDFLAPLPVRRLVGVGPKFAQKLKEKHGIETIGQIIALGPEFEMIRRFGRTGRYFFRVISGKGRTTVEPNDYFAGKSISKGRTFFGRTTENGEQVSAENILPELIDKVHARLVKKHFRYKTVTLEIKLQDSFKIICRSRSFHSANDDKERITITAFELLEEIKKLQKPIRKIAVRVSNFEKYDPCQKTLLDYMDSSAASE